MDWVYCHSMNPVSAPNQACLSKQISLLLLLLLLLSSDLCERFTPDCSRLDM